jgi:hypothetical protein
MVLNRHANDPSAPPYDAADSFSVATIVGANDSATRSSRSNAASSPLSSNRRSPHGSIEVQLADTSITPGSAPTADPDRRR